MAGDLNGELHTLGLGTGAEVLGLPGVWSETRFCSLLLSLSWCGPRPFPLVCSHQQLWFRIPGK